MSGVFEPTLLPISEKERLVRDLLDEFELKVHTHSKTRQELIIPCTVSPKHKNQTREPTGAINYDKLVYKCLGCKASGGLLWFIAWHRGSSSTEARDWLGKETGTDGHLMDLTALLRYFDALYPARGARAPMTTFSGQMLEPWAMLHPWVTDPIEYDAQGRNIGGRGIPEESALKFQVGYAPEYFMGKGVPTSERIVIPHFWRGDLVGWQTRRLAADGTPKYKSSGDFPKDTTLYNYDPSQETVVVVESPMSVLRHDHHQHMVGTFGANITDAQVRLLGRYKKVIYWLDNDSAGWDAYSDLVDNRGKVTRLGVLEQTAQMTNTWVVQSPYHADPADLDDQTVDDLVAQAVPWVLWALPRILVCHRCGEKAHEGGCDG